MAGSALVVLICLFALALGAWAGPASEAVPGATKGADGQYFITTFKSQCNTWVQARSGFIAGI